MKLVSEIKTNVYELTYLVSDGFTDSEAKKVQEEIVALVKKYKGEILSETVWGKKPLAYSIRKTGKIYDEAYFVHLRLSLISEKAPEFEKGIYLNNSVIRHLLVVGSAEVKKEETSEE